MRKKVAAKTGKTARGKEAKEEPAPRRGWWRALFRWAWIVAAWLATLLFLAGLPMRLLGDSVDTLAFLFYATPWGVLMVCGLIATWHWRGWRRFALGLLVATLLCVGGWLWTDVRFGASDRGAPSFRVGYWNCGRPEWRLRGILPMAQSWHADLMGFGESREGNALSPKWAEEFPKFKVQAVLAEMLLIGPDNAELKSSGSLGGRGSFQLCRTTLGGREVFVLLVDFDETPTKSRGPAFERLYQLVDAYATKPLIVMGDFNTPGDSTYFKRLKIRMTDAFDNAGAGLAATWPMITPVLSIDHILVNKFLRVVHCEHGTSLYSDHRAVVADLAWP